MDLTTLIIGVSMMAAAIIPVLILIHRSNMKNNRLKKTFVQLTANHNITLSEQEAWGDKFIGIDKTNHKVVFISHDVPGGEVIDLKSSIKAELLKDIRESAERKTFTSKIGLLFTLKDAEKVLIPFFDLNTDDPLQFQHNERRAERWYQLINEK